MSETPCKRFDTGWLCKADCHEPLHYEFLKPTPTMYDCASDCVERAQCEEAGKPGHTSCGVCDFHKRPIHHCAHAECFNQHLPKEN